MLEIFDKAREYARMPMGGKVFYETERALRRKGELGQWRLHHQAYKLMKIAEEHCLERRRCEPQDTPLAVGEIIEELNCIQCRHGEGWSHEGRWMIRDYHSPEALNETLQFFRSMGLAYYQKDFNNLREALHLRMSESDFDLVFNPVLNASRDRGSRRA